MSKAWGTRLLAALCFLIGGGTIILIPVLWPIGYGLVKKARAKEAAADERAELYELQRQVAEQHLTDLDSVETDRDDAVDLAARLELLEDKLAEEGEQLRGETDDETEVTD